MKTQQILGSLGLISTLSLSSLFGCGAPAVDGDGDSSSSGDGDSGSGGGDGDTSKVIPDECEDDCEGGLSSCTASVPGNALLRRLTVSEFSYLIDHTFPEAAGSWTSTISQDPVNHFGFDNGAERVVTKQVAKEIDTTAESIGTAVGAQLASLLPCSTSSADASCASEFLAKYGRRLFRRPLSEDETSSYLDYFNTALSKTDFPSAISWLTRALVHATPTLYRHEIGEADGGLRRLNAFEVASELAFTFSGRPPSDELLDLAASGGLDSQEAILAEADKLVRSPEGKEHLHQFFEASFEYAKVRTLTKNDSSVDFSQLRDQMVLETRAFIENIVMENSGTVADLLTAAVSYPTAALSTHYGWPAPSADYTEVARPAGHGVGILAQGSVLATEAKSDSSSPTQRGLLVMEKLLCREPPPVPAAVPELPELQEGQMTTRERYESLHAGSGSCANCHKAFDPIGFGFEHFDELGRYRADEDGLTINSTSFVPNMAPAVDFTSQEELAQGLAGRSEVGQCLSSQLKAYVFATDEACLGESQRTALSTNGTGFVNYLISLAAEPHFTTRRSF